MRRRPPSTRLRRLPLLRFTGEDMSAADLHPPLRSGGGGPPEGWWRGRQRLARTLAATLFAVLSIAATAPNDPADRLADPAQESRARALFKEVRCLVCQNESIDDSEAELAGDLRKAVRTQVAAGRSDGEVKRYLVYRYGEFVLLKPTLSLGNAVLWLTPFLLVIGGGAVLFLRRRRTLEPTPPLSEDEAAALAALDIASASASGPGSAAEAPHEKQSAMAEAGVAPIGAPRVGT